MGKPKEDKIRLIEEKSNNRSYKTVQDESYAEGGRNKGVSVVWKNLRVTARINKEHTFRSTEHIYKEIIHNVSGCVKPNSLVAIMGASGSGKSTLMSVLANRHPAELRIDGDIRVNGKRVRIKHMRRISGYVYQDDLFIPSLTVSEHMHFAAQLKLDRRISLSKRKQIVEDLLIDVGLMKCENSLIGTSSFGKGKVNLSGGEQKRLSVATELLTDPPLVFCDEPTTGLDSFSALKLMTVMKDMTIQKNKTIICSIHQPNEQIFSLFHQVVLLYSGKIAFSGTPQDAVAFFKSVGYEHTGNQNSAEFLIKSLAIMPGYETETADKASDICKQFDASEYAVESARYIEENTQDEDGGFPIPPKVERHSWIYLFYLMLYRNFLAIVRDPSMQGMTIVYKASLGLIIGVCLMGTCTMTQEGIQSLKGALFTMVAENFFSPTYAAMDRIPKQMPVFLREYSNNINSPSLFYFASLVSITPGMILDSTIFSTLIYWLTGLRPELNIFLWTVLVNAMVLNTSNAFGTLLGVLTNNLQTAQLIVLPLDIIYMILAGIFISLRTVPIIFAWIRYVSWMTLSCENLLILQLYDVDYIACPDDPTQPCLKTGQAVLEQLDFNTENFSRNIIEVFIIYFIFHILGCLLFSVKMYYKTKSKSLLKKKK